MKNLDEIIANEEKNTKKNWNNQIDGSYILSDTQIREIFATKHEVDLERDENGIPIPGTGRIITNEEKKSVFDYILENNYPLTKKVYNIILRAYLDNELEINIKQGPKL